MNSVTFCKLLSRSFFRKSGFVFDFLVIFHTAATLLQISNAVPQNFIYTILGFVINLFQTGVLLRIESKHRLKRVYSGNMLEQIG